MYLKEIDVGKGLAISLVVAGHLIGTDYLAQYPVYGYVRNILYAFHIPFFYFLAGITFGISYERSAGYFSFLRKKSVRIIVPYFVYSLLVFFGKIIFSNYSFYVTNRVQSLDDLYNLFIYPNNSFAQYLWFIYILFLFYVTVPLFLRLLKNYCVAIIAIFLFVLLLPDTHLLSIHNYRYYMLFFVSGVFVYKYYSEFKDLISKYGLIFCAIFFLFIMFSGFISDLYIAAAAIPSLYYISIYLSSSKSHFLASLGKKSFSIYLMHMIVIGVLTAFVFKISGGYTYGFFLLILLFFSGLFVPLLIKEYIIAKHRILQLLFG